MNTNKHLVLVILAMILAISMACNLTDSPSNANYSKAVMHEVLAIHNGNKTELKIFDYYKYYEDKQEVNEIAILHGENARPWLQFKIVIQGNSSQISLYENISNQWVHIETVDNPNNKSIPAIINNLVRNKYQLEFLRRFLYDFGIKE